MSQPFTEKCPECGGTMMFTWGYAKGQECWTCFADGTEVIQHRNDGILQIQLASTTTDTTGQQTLTSRPTSHP